jgi:hypothetical protein
VSRLIRLLVLMFIACSMLVANAATDSSSIESFFAGKEVVLKIDMPGSNKGVNLRFNKNPAMNWKEYSQRMKQFGPALRKGDVARVTTIVVKRDMIEFQLDGGGFGTFLDDSNTKVEAKSVDKSDYEKSLERQIANSTDDDERRRLQRDLDRERSRRERQESANRSDAEVASQIKAEKVAGDRMRGGSRFNLRWDKSIPPDQQNPQAVMRLLSEYVDFSNWQSGSPAVTGSSGQNSGQGSGQGSAVQDSSGDTPAVSGSPSSGSASLGGEVPNQDNVDQGPADQSGSPTAHLKRGMKLSEVNDLLGQGQKKSESSTPDGMKTEIYDYTVDDREVTVTYVEGIVIRFSISSK